MATNTCTDCGCKKCGCTDTGLITPIACPTPIGCPSPEPCSEVINAQCIVYTGLDIECNDDIVVETDTTLADALVDIVTYFCDNGGGGGTGPAGPVGPPGIQGAQGVAGPTGPQGTAGSAGGAGATGATGPQGIQGVAGPIGPAGLNWQGAWSSLGVYAPDDAVGFAGASWFCLNAVGPSVSNPTIDPTNWALLASEGAVGPAGPTGASGVAGAAGATGPQGLTGPAGAQGIQGITGPTGAQGPQGIQGIPGTGTGTTNIGKLLGGGIVVAEWNESGVQKGLIASLTNLATNIPWTVPAQQTVLIGSTAQSASTGFTNTNAIIAQTGTAAAITYAAGLARLHNGGGYTDWYLPAKWELNMCYNSAGIVNKILGSLNGFVDGSLFSGYWTSTEYDSSNAWLYFFSNGNQNGSTKSGGANVRAVRIHNI